VDPDFSDFLSVPEPAYDEYLNQVTVRLEFTLPVDTFWDGSYTSFVEFDDGERIGAEMEEPLQAISESTLIISLIITRSFRILQRLESVCRVGDGRQPQELLSSLPNSLQGRNLPRSRRRGLLPGPHQPRVGPRRARVVIRRVLGSGRRQQRRR